MLSRTPVLPLSPYLFAAWLTAMAGEFPDILLHYLSFWLSLSWLLVGLLSLLPINRGSQGSRVVPACSQYRLLKVSVKEKRSEDTESAKETCDCDQGLSSRQGGRFGQPGTSRCCQVSWVEGQAPTPLPKLTGLVLRCLYCSFSSKPSLALDSKSRSLLPPHPAWCALHFPYIKKSGMDFHSSQGGLSRQTGMMWAYASLPVPYELCSSSANHRIIKS